MRLLKHIINSDRRDYIIEKVNAPLLWLIIKYANRYPEPTPENVVHPNSHRLLEFRDEFFKYWKTDRSSALYKSLWKVVIVKYEHSPNWRNMLDWLFMVVGESDWKPFNPNRQMHQWKGVKNGSI